MVTSPDGKGVILIGCVENGQVTETIYELSAAPNRTLIWNKMLQKLQFPRMNAAVMPIPDELTKCEHFH